MFLCNNPITVQYIFHNMEDFCVIIPTYREKENLIRLLPVLRKYYPNASVYIVDDNSPDGTTQWLTSVRQEYQQVRPLVRKNQRGRGSAVYEGLRRALKQSKTPYFVEMDADFSHDPKDIAHLLKHAGPKTVVIGSRYCKGSRIINWPWWRKILSYPANWYARFFLGIPIYDYTNGFRLYPKAAVKLLSAQPLREQGYAALSESAYYFYKKGFAFVEVPIVFVNRRRGESNTRFSEYLKTLIAVVRIRFSVS